MNHPAATASLRWRLLAATLAGVAVALLLAGWALTTLFRDHATAQFRDALRLQLDQVTAGVDFDAQGEPVFDSTRLTDPRWDRPYSGLYWQIDGARQQRGLLRSRSLWDVALVLPADALGDGDVHTHQGTGPQQAPLLMLERSVRPAQAATGSVRVVVAATTAPLDAAVAGFRTPLALSLAVLFVLLAGAAWAQVAVGLAPLTALRQALDQLRAGAATRLEGRFPREVQPLVDDFNAVLAQNAAVVERARQHAGNLAHAVKTPLAVLQQVGEQLARLPGDSPALGQQVQEQVTVARRHVDWHLARSRSAGALRPGNRATAVAPVVQGLLRVLQRVHADQALQFDLDLAPGLAFSGEEQDLQELLGNLLDNAGKWAHRQVHLQGRVGADPRLPLELDIDDDGPGIAADQLAAMPQRGARLDESKPGTGLGLAIARDLAELYGGQLLLEASPLGGLGVRLRLPGSGA